MPKKRVPYFNYNTVTINGHQYFKAYAMNADKKLIIVYGKTIDEVGIEPFVGPCYVARHEGDVSGEDAAAIYEKAEHAGAAGRILIAGKATVTEAAARVFAANGVCLVGNESQTVGPEDEPMAVHLILLGAGCVLLEGIVLTGVEEGTYTLHAAPLNLGGCDGAPCRAYLIKE